MRRVAVVGTVLVAVLAAWTFVALRIVPPFAREKLETGAELSLPDQLFIAGGNLWARWFILIVIVVGAAYAWWANAVIAREATGRR